MATELEDSQANATVGAASDKLSASAVERAPSLYHFLRRALHGYDELRLVMAVVLLTAAGLKAQELMTKPVLGTGLLESRWFLIGAVEFELFFSLWLLSTLLPNVSGALRVPITCRTRSVPDTFGPSSSGTSGGGEGLAGVECPPLSASLVPPPHALRLTPHACAEPSLTWLASLALFSAFGCVSLWKALGGEANCGCFGRLEVNPWLTTAMDWAFVAALIRFRPQSPRPKRFAATFRPLRVACVVAIWALVGGPVGFAVSSFHPTTFSDAGSVIGEGNLVVLEPERWVGKRLPLLDHIDIATPFASSGTCHPNCEGYAFALPDHSGHLSNQPYVAAEGPQSVCCSHPTFG